MVVEFGRCKLCNSVVTNYEHRVRFVIVDGERVRDGDYAHLSCGCEVLGYDLEIDCTADHQPVKMLDNLRKTVILEFKDDGPMNRTWEEYDDCR